MYIRISFLQWFALLLFVQRNNLLTNDTIVDLYRSVIVINLTIPLALLA